MSKIIGVTVGTPTSPLKINDELKPVKTVNGSAPDDNGNVIIGAGDIGAATDFGFVESTEFPGCYYREVSTTVLDSQGNKGTIVEAEWLNPPIIYGEVFRTTRKKGNAPIYKLLLSTGALSPESTKTIDAQTAFRYVDELSTEFALVPSAFLRVYSTFYSWDNPKTVDGVTIFVWGSGLYVNAQLICSADSTVTGYETCLLDIEFTADWIF